MACYHLPSVRCTECAYGYGTFFPTGPTPPFYPTIPQQTPHKCPVCEGTGKVSLDFYGDEGDTFLNIPGRCRSCTGGVIWR